MKQRYLVGKMNVPDEKDGGHDEVTMDTLGEDSWKDKSHLFLSPTVNYFADMSYSLPL